MIKFISIFKPNRRFGGQVIRGVRLHLEASKNRMSKQRIVIVAVAIIVSVSCGKPTGQSTGTGDFRKYRARYEAAIGNARELARKPEEPFSFRSDWQFDVLAEPEDTNVCAVRTKSGMLFVRILAYNHHLGVKFGYIYTETSMVPEEIDQMLVSYGCGEWTLTEKLNDNWWVIESSTVF